MCRQIVAFIFYIHIIDMYAYILGWVKKKEYLFTLGTLNKIGPQAKNFSKYELRECPPPCSFLFIFFSDRKIKISLPNTWKNISFYTFLRKMVFYNFSTIFYLIIKKKKKIVRWIAFPLHIITHTCESVEVSRNLFFGVPSEKNISFFNAPYYISMYIHV